MVLSTGLFLWISLGYLLVTAAYPISLAVKLRRHGDDAARWLKNTPAFTVYLPFMFSLGAGLLLASFPWADFLALPRFQLASAIVLFVFFALMALFASLEDSRRTTIMEPFMFRRHAEPLKVEQQVRHSLRGRRVSKNVRSGLMRKYEIIAPPFQNIRNLRAGGSPTAFIAYGLNALVALTIAFLFWYLGVAVLFKVAMDRSIIAVVMGVMFLWFPVRLYTEWYLWFYSLDHLRRFFAFWFILLAAVLGYAFFIFAAGGGVARAFSLTVAGMLGLIGLLGRFKPRWLGLVAEVIDEMPPRWFAAAATTIVVSLMIMVCAIIAHP